LSAHAAAYNRARILHRDVSAGNILITDKGWRHFDQFGTLTLFPIVKLLVLWSGTWQFISVARLLDPFSAPHQVSDDLESFFWVPLYQIDHYPDISRPQRPLKRQLHSF
ncbi:hypothetical protein BC826DRAFT_910504, partial [Russula brevipes]